jgi:hypothetical protein
MLAGGCVVSKQNRWLENQECLWTGVIHGAESRKPISGLIREDPRKSASMFHPATLRTWRLGVQIPESSTITMTIDDYDRL